MCKKYSKIVVSVSCIVVMTLVMSFAGYTQVNKLDSLHDLLDQESSLDAKAKIHLTLADEYTSLNFDSSRHYATLAIELALKGDMPKTVIKATIILSQISTYGGDFLLSDSLLRTAYHISKKEVLREELGNVFLAQGLLSEFQSEFDQALLYYDSARQLFDEISFKEGVGDCYMNKAIVHYSTGNLKDALYNFDLASAVYLEIGDLESQVFVLNNSGNVYKLLGLLDKASNNYYEALKFFEQDQDKSGIANSLLNLGNIEIQLENYQKAKKLLLRAFHLINEIGDDNNLIGVSQNLGVVYSSENNYDSSNHYFKIAEQTSAKLTSVGGLAMALESIGENYFHEGAYDSAASYFLQSLEYKIKENKPRNLILTYLNLARLFDELGQSKKAKDYFDLALVKAQETEAKDILSTLYWELYDYHKRKNDLSSALKYLEAYQIARDSLINEQKTEQILAQEIKYESEKKEAEIARQNLEVQRQNEVIKSHSTERVLLIGMVASILLVSILLFVNYRTKLRAREQLVEQNKVFEKDRSRFFAGISHEFRTPLALITAPLSELRSKYSNDRDTLWILELIQRNSNRLLSLINQLLDLSKLEAGKLVLSVSKKDIISWSKLISASFESLATSREIHYETQFPGSDFELYFDEEKLEQVLINLLSNAFKYTVMNGEVRFLVSVSPQGVTFQVKNTGRKIPDAEKDRIFDRFYQSAANNKSEGTGIGLALVKEFSELHHGSVRVYDDEDWTVFEVSVPVDDAAYAGDEKLENNVNAVTKLVDKQSEVFINTFMDTTLTEDRPLVLVVEDNDDLRDYISYQLSVEFVVEKAMNGLEGVQLAQSIPDLIITDLMMPEMDGMELLRVLRTEAKTRHIPIIMLTAKAEKENKIQGLSEGADHYLNKPFDSDELITRVRSLIIQRHRIKDHYYKEFLTAPKAEDIVSADDLFLKNAVESLEKELDNHEFSVDQFAKDLAMSRTQLHRKLKAIIGCSASEFVRHYRIKKANEFLKSGKGTVSEIAYSVGFNNLSYFTKSFKEVYKKSPSEVLK